MSRAGPLERRHGVAGGVRIRRSQLAGRRGNAGRSSELPAQRAAHGTAAFERSRARSASPKSDSAAQTGDTAPRASATPREIELKLALPKAAVAPLLRWLRTLVPAARRAVPLVAVYYDTAEHDLREQGLTLRVRRNGRRHVQTVKLETGESAALMNRGEWEHEVAGKPSLAHMAGTELGSILDEDLERRLVPLFEARVRRRTYPIESGTSAFELTIDEGEIVADRRRAPICEIELELKRGDAGDLFAFARRLTEQVPAQIEVRSKAERGYDLVAGKGLRPAHATPIAVAADASCRTAFQTIARSCLRQVVANRALAAEGTTEGVHQIRVGLRRLRVAISLFRGMLRDPQTDRIRGELKWIVGALGPARELDVFAQRIAARATDASLPGVAAFIGDLGRRRAAALADARLAVESDRFRLAVLDTAAWIENGDWTNNPDDLVRARREQPVATAAAAELERHRRKIVKRAPLLTALDPAARHAVRIEAKKLRYGAEFFAGVFPTKKARTARKELLAALSRLQDVLGELNDIAVHERLIEQLAFGTEQSAGRKRGSASKAFAAGRLAGHEEARAAPLLESAARACSRFSAIKPFWR